MTEWMRAYYDEVDGLDANGAAEHSAEVAPSSWRTLL